MAGSRMRMRILTYDGIILEVEDFLKKELYQHNIGVKEAAVACGMEEYSFRNKMSRHAFGIKDIVTLTEMAGYQLAIVDPNAGNGDLKPVVFRFHPEVYGKKKEEYLAKVRASSKESELRITEAVSSKQQKKSIDSPQETDNDFVASYDDVSESKHAPNITIESHRKMTTSIDNVVVYRSPKDDLFVISGDRAQIAKDALEEIINDSMPRSKMFGIIRFVETGMNVIIEQIDDEVRQRLQDFIFKCKEKTE